MSFRKYKFRDCSALLPHVDIDGHPCYGDPLREREMLPHEAHKRESRRKGALDMYNGAMHK